MSIAEPETGIYQIDRGPESTGLQFVVIPQLDRIAYPILRALSPADSVQDVQACIAALAGYDCRSDARYARRIVDYMLANLPKEVESELRKDAALNRALLEYANPEFRTVEKEWQLALTKETERANRAENELVQLKAKIARLEKEKGVRE